jgi:hypothetical protein
MKLRDGISSFLYAMTEFVTMVLSGNLLSDSVRISISKLTKLTKLHLRNFASTGIILQFIGYLGELRVLQLDSCRLKGSIPSSFSKFSKLRQFFRAGKKILSHTKTFPKGRIIVDTSYPDHSTHPIENHTYWKDFYPESEEEIPNDLPLPKGPKVRMTLHVNAVHAHDLMTRRSITGILVM